MLTFCNQKPRNALNFFDYDYFLSLPESFFFFFSFRSFRSGVINNERENFIKFYKNENVESERKELKDMRIIDKYKIASWRIVI